MMRYRLRDGFSLVEVLFTIVIVSLTLIGVAALLANAIGASRDALWRTVAAQQAYEMADLLRANLPASLAGHYAAGASASGPSCGTCATCSALQLAQHDVCIWQQRLASLLPSGQGKVSRIGDRYTVEVSWASAPGESAGERFALEVDP